MFRMCRYESGIFVSGLYRIKGDGANSYHFYLMIGIYTSFQR